MSQSNNINEPSLFHCPIDQLLKKDDGMPVFIPVVCKFLMDFSGTVGIFRLCGNHEMVQKLGIVFNMPECAVPPSATVHDVSSFLKQWLRQLPEPLIPPNLINDNYDPSNPNSVIPVLRQMPVTNRKCLASIFAVIYLVLQQKDTNQMGPSNIVTCFVRSLLQESKGLRKFLPFTAFFDKCVEYLNDLGDDFNLPQE